MSSNFFNFQSFLEGELKNKHFFVWLNYKKYLLIHWNFLLPNKKRWAIFVCIFVKAKNELNWRSMFQIIYEIIWCYKGLKIKNLEPVILLLNLKHLELTVFTHRNRFLLDSNEFYEPRIHLKKEFVEAFYFNSKILERYNNKRWESFLKIQKAVSFSPRLTPKDPKLSTPKESYLSPSRHQMKSS